MKLSSGFIVVALFKAYLGCHDRPLNAGATDFEAWINREKLEAVYRNVKTQDDASITLTYLPGATCEELPSACDPSRPDRKFFDVSHGQDEWAGFADELGTFAPNPRSKTCQSDFNYLIDKGTPAKVVRDESKAYGKNLFESYAQKQRGSAEKKRVCYHSLSGMNARHAAQIVDPEEPFGACRAWSIGYLGAHPPSWTCPTS